MRYLGLQATHGSVEAAVSAAFAKVFGRDPDGNPAGVELLSKETVRTSAQAILTSPALQAKQRIEARKSLGTKLWWFEAAFLSKRGFKTGAIATALGKSNKAVYYALKNLKKRKQWPL